MNQTVEQFIKKHNLIEEDDHIIVGVSGGVDSMALLHYLSSSFPNQITVAHVEHGLRGKASVEDMEFVKIYCGKKGIPFFYHQPDVVKLMKEKGYSTQEAARECRYSWFHSLMKQFKANKLAVAHHGDDQIETVLMRQVRGSLTGLQGIPVKRKISDGFIIRPFLCVSKKDIIDYCSDNGVTYREDESNYKDTYQRNRFRKVLPFLKEENPKVHQSFQRQSEWIQEDNRLLELMAKKEIETVIIKKNQNNIQLSIDGFLSIPTPLQRRGLHLILNYLSPDAEHFLNGIHVDDMITLMEKQFPSGMIHLPKGIVVEKSYNRCLITKESGKKEADCEDKKVLIPIPGLVHWKTGKITSTIHKNEETGSNGDAIFFADAKAIDFPLYVRSRRHGDRISPLGLKGSSKKIKSIFIDAKIPKAERETWPIVTDANGQVIWIPFLKRSEIGKVTAQTEEVITLVFNKDDENIKR
ncbi:tRNA lysidine(34) synthetase TilS [Litchfieldia alkalitelluris]|nr:tRNA lysidine(34) synthetase TilS [Litchfieldia alkalitelluris]